MSFFSFNAFKENEGEKKKRKTNKWINQPFSFSYFSRSGHSGFEPDYTQNELGIPIRKFFYILHRGIKQSSKNKNKVGDDSLTSFLYEMNPKLYFILF